MVDCLHERTLYRSQTITVTDVRCRPHDDRRGGEEHTSTNDIVFPRSGLFIQHVRGERVVADPNRVLFFRSGESYRVSHPLRGGDDCTVLSYAPDVLADAFAETDPAVRDRPDDPFSRRHCPSSARACLAHQTLRRRAERGRSEAIELDDLALGLLDVVAESARDDRPVNPRRTRWDTLRTHRAHVEAAKVVLTERFAEPLALARIAAAVHCSPFHLARVFRHIVGVPIHRYLIRLRLRASLERLASVDEPGGAAWDLTGLALDLGYSSHSHFTDSFVREFGLTPSAFRNGLTRSRLREMSKIPKA